jgi:hypothetical protein
MIRTPLRAGTFAAAPQPVILRIVRCDGPVVIPKQHSQRPAWSLLYASMLLALVALLANDLLLPESLARSLTQLLAIFGCIGLTRLWIGANRRSLSRTKEVQPIAGESGAHNLSDREVGNGGSRHPSTTRNTSGVVRRRRAPSPDSIPPWMRNASRCATLSAKWAPHQTQGAREHERDAGCPT